MTRIGRYAGEFRWALMGILPTLLACGPSTLSTGSYTVDHSTVTSDTCSGLIPSEGLDGVLVDLVVEDNRVSLSMDALYSLHTVNLMGTDSSSTTL